MKYYIGIDPGLHGAIAILSDTVEIYDYEDKAWQKRLRELRSRRANMSAVLEDVHNMPGQDISGGDKFMKNAGRWEGWLESLEIPTELKTPQAWMSKVFDKRPSKIACTLIAPKEIDFHIGAKDIFEAKNNYKEALRMYKNEKSKITSANKKVRKQSSLEFARRKFPMAAHLLTRVKDHDRAEALLIAYYGKIISEGKPFDVTKYDE